MPAFTPKARNCEICTSDTKFTFISVECPDPTCSDHGFCVDGSCVCKKGWKGDDCSLMDEEARQCLPDCSGNGYFDLEEGQCICKDGWSQDGVLLRTSQIFLMLTWHLVGPFFFIQAKWSGDERKLNHYSVLNFIQSVFQALPMAVMQWCVIEGYAEIYKGTFFGCDEWHLAIVSALVSTFSIFKGLVSCTYHGRRASI